MLCALSLASCYPQPESYVAAPYRAPAATPIVLAEASGPLALVPAVDSGPGVLKTVPGAQPSYAGSLTLGEAVRRALRFSPAVHAAQIEIDAKRAEAWQAGLRRNPEISGDVQNIDQAAQESTLELSQVFELGGKRLKRIRAAELDTGVAAWDFEAARLRVASNTALTFVDVLASQDRIAILDDLQNVADRLSGAVSERVNAGEGNPVELRRAQIESARAKAELSAERTFLETAKRRLANNWGAQGVDFAKADGHLATGERIPSVRQVSAYLDANPEISRWATEMTRRQAVLALAQASAIPDLTLGAGARRVNENDETGAIVSLSIPIPLFNRNQGNIAAAQTRILKGQSESLAARTDVTGSLLESYGNLVVAAEKLKGLEKDVLPAAREVYTANIEGYTAGKFDLLGVLDAQRTLFSTRLEIVNTRAEFQKAKVQIEALIGRGLNSL